MTDTRDTDPKTQRFDRPSTSVPSVDRPWDDPVDHAHRLRSREGDRSAHRSHHSLFEDMLN